LSALSAVSLAKRLERAVVLAIDAVDAEHLGG
jgi:hypothetical protein